jgi:hypothetical protein
MTNYGFQIGRKPKGSKIESRVVLEENAPAEIEYDGTNLHYGCSQMKQHREDRAQVRSVFGWDSIIVFGGFGSDNLLSEFRTSSSLSSPKSIEI